MIDSSLTLDISSETLGSTVVVRVAGDVDMRSAPEFERALMEAMYRLVPPSALVADLTGVEFIGSHGLAVLLRLHLRCAGTGRRFLVVADRRVVLRPMELTSLRTALTVLPTLVDALAEHVA
ncbi:STAS domain-containing protein [Actinosynnema sp. NPDC023587]|uniref:STAS domain-containing protein n=1 Tax=Actinosynnema sp. NPDC023587 TaxID=3154695 RepID=UPI003407E75E